MHSLLLLVGLGVRIGGLKVETDSEKLLFRDKTSLGLISRLLGSLGGREVTSVVLAS